MRYHERMVMLSVIDGLWKDHLLSMDHLKEGIGLRGYAQQDPLVAYKRESFDMFEAMMAKFQEDTVRFLFRMQILGPDGRPIDAAPEPRRAVPPAPPVASAEQLTLNGDGQPTAARCAAARDRHSHACAFHHHRPVGEGVRTARSSANSKRPRAPERRKRQPALAAPHRRKSRPQRSLPLRLRQEVQEVPRRGSIAQT